MAFLKDPQSRNDSEKKEQEMIQLAASSLDLTPDSRFLIKVPYLKFPKIWSGKKYSYWIAQGSEFFTSPLICTIVLPRVWKNGGYGLFESASDPLSTSYGSPDSLEAPKWLQVIEYLSSDGFDWGRQYRVAGYYTACMLWYVIALTLYFLESWLYVSLRLSFYTWIVSFVCLAFLPHYFSRCVFYTGAFMGIGEWASRWCDGSINTAYELRQSAQSTRALHNPWAAAYRC